MFPFFFFLDFYISLVFFFSYFKNFYLIKPFLFSFLDQLILHQLNNWIHILRHIYTQLHTFYIFLTKKEKKKQGIIILNTHHPQKLHSHYRNLYKILQIFLSFCLTNMRRKGFFWCMSDFYLCASIINFINRVSVIFPFILRENVAR